MKPTRAKDPSITALRYHYFVLAFLCLVYILIIDFSSFFPSTALSVVFRLASVAAVLLLARYVPFLHAATVDREIGFSVKPCLTTLWLLIPFVGLVFASSLLSAKLAAWCGVSTAYPFGEQIWLTILVSALIPAVTEELFCRYIFLPRLSVFSRSGAIFASALFFSFLHGNLYQIPYALVAGLALGALAVGCGSVLPCILFHFVNNLTSILLHYYGDTPLPHVLLSVLIVGMIAAVIYAFIVKRRLWERLRTVFSCDRMTGHTVACLFTTPIVLLIVIFILIAIFGGSLAA